jgi:DNA polymerase I-like protein with 3'-5' exonuclease and polymerase domains
MIRVADFLEANSLKTQLIMQVHDELVFDVFP